MADAGTTDQVGQPPEGGRMEPIAVIDHVHQSGVASIAVHACSPERGEYLVATGGDDQSMSVLLLHLDAHQARATLLTRASVPLAHRAALTDVQWAPHGPFLFSTGADQRVALWHWQVSTGEGVEESTLTLTFHSAYFVEVADTSSIQVLSLSSEEKSYEYRVVVGGMGLQCLRVCPSLPPQ